MYALTKNMKKYYIWSKQNTYMNWNNDVGAVSRDICSAISAWCVIQVVNEVW
jgi:hypothetical protein